MDINIRDLIEYQGIGGYISTNVRAVKSIEMFDSIHVPDIKPDIKEITKIKSSIEASGGSLIKTAKGKSLEGKVLTGLKYQINIYYKVRVEYIPVKCSSSIMTFDYTKSLIEFITIENKYEPDDSFIENAIIEDLNVELSNPRSLILNTSALIMVENREW